MSENGLTKEEEHYAINRIIKMFQKSSKSLCRIGAESVKVRLNRYCDFCKIFYHSRCPHPTCSFESTFPTNRYVFQSCIENNYQSFHCFISFHVSAELYNYIENFDCMSNLFDNWKKSSDSSKENCENVSIPMEHHYGSRNKNVF